MEDWFALQLIQRQEERLAAELRSCNDVMGRYGLLLSEAQVQGLAQRRGEALQETGRLEFGEGIAKQLLLAFCDSPYITQDNLEETCWELLDSFYYFKNECLERLADDELIALMRRHFDGVCQGSLEYLAGTTLEELCRYLRSDGEQGELDRLF